MFSDGVPGRRRVLVVAPALVATLSLGVWQGVAFAADPLNPAEDVDSVASATEATDAAGDAPAEVTSEASAAPEVEPATEAEAPTTEVPEPADVGSEVATEPEPEAPEPASPVEDAVESSATTEGADTPVGETATAVAPSGEASEPSTSNADGGEPTSSGGAGSASETVAATGSASDEVVATGETATGADEAAEIDGASAPGGSPAQDATSGDPVTDPTAESPAPSISSTETVTAGASVLESAEAEVVAAQQELSPSDETAAAPAASSAADAGSTILETADEVVTSATTQLVEVAGLGVELTETVGEQVDVQAAIAPTHDSTTESVSGAPDAGSILETADEVVTSATTQLVEVAGLGAELVETSAEEVDAVATPDTSTVVEASAEPFVDAATQLGGLVGLPLPAPDGGLGGETPATVDATSVVNGVVDPLVTSPSTLDATVELAEQSVSTTVNDQVSGSLGVAGSVSDTTTALGPDAGETVGSVTGETVGSVTGDVQSPSSTTAAVGNVLGAVPSGSGASATVDNVEVVAPSGSAVVTSSDATAQLSDPLTSGGAAAPGQLPASNALSGVGQIQPDLITSSAGANPPQTIVVADNTPASASSASALVATAQTEDTAFPAELVSLGAGAEADGGASRPGSEGTVRFTRSAAAFVRREVLILTPSDAARVVGVGSETGERLFGWTPGWLPFTGFVLILPLVGGALLLMSGGRVALWYGKRAETV